MKTMLMNTSVALGAALGAALSFAACAQEAPEAAAPAAPVMPETTDADWRPLDAENTLVLEIQKRDPVPGAPEPVVVIELSPDLAPGHVARIKALARQGFYDGRVFHRVIPDFMAQAGGTLTDPSGGDSGLPDLQREFTARVAGDAPVTLAQDARIRQFDGQVTQAGFLNGFPVAYQPAAQAMVSADGKRDVWMLHCPGTMAFARTSVPDTANFQFYITNGDATFLDGNYTAVGRVRAGQDAVNAIKPGEPVAAPDLIGRMRPMNDLPADERPNLEVLRTDSAVFQQMVDAARMAAGPAMDVCGVEVPVREAQ